jgi:AraC-like DNA-binding protein
LENVLRDWLRELGAGLSRTLRESRLNEMELDAFLREEALVRQVVDLSEEAIRATLLNTLRSRGWLHALSARAEAKKRALEEIGKDSVTTHTSGISPADLQAWFCRELAPGQLFTVSPEQLVARLGYDDPSTMSRALLREYYYRQYSTQKGITPPVLSLDDRNNFP